LDEKIEKQEKKEIDEKEFWKDKIDISELDSYLSLS
jgi:hypothetical protein